MGAGPCGSVLFAVGAISPVRTYMKHSAAISDARNFRYSPCKTLLHDTLRPLNRKYSALSRDGMASKVSGTIMTGPASTHEKCLGTIGLLPDPVIKGPALKHEQCRPTTMMYPLSRPVLQPFRPCRRFLFIKLARNEAEPSAKAKHSEGARPSHRQCMLGSAAFTAIVCP
jgi:hypothetical protein